MSELANSVSGTEAKKTSSTEGFSTAYTNYALGLLVLVSVFNAVDRSILTVLLEPIKQDMHLSDLQLGLISGIAFSLFYATLGIPFARWADLGSRRTLLSLTVGLWSIMTALSGSAQNFLQLFLTRVGVGIGEAGGTPAALSLLSELYPVRKGGVATALFLVGGTLGSVIGMWGGAVVAEHWGWRMAFVVMGVPGVLLALLLKATLREPRQHCRLPTVSEALGKDFLVVARELFSKPSFLYCTIAFTLFGVFGQGSGQWSISYIVRSFDISLEQAGAIFGLVVGGSAIVGTFLGGYVANYIGARDERGYLLFPAGVMVLCIPVYMIVYTTDSINLVIAMSALAGLVMGLMTPCIYACVFGVSGSKNRAMGLAILGMFSALIGGGFGPLIIGGISDLLFPHFGQDSLRLALMCSVGFVPLSVFYFYRASKTLSADFESPSNN